MDVSNYLIVSNNPKARDFTDFKLEAVEGNCLDVMNRSLALISEGYRLISHPLAGSIKPNQNLYRSILLCKEVNKKIDYQGLKLMNNCLVTAEDMIEKNGFSQNCITYAEDLQIIDMDLLNSAISSIIQGR